MEDDPWDWPTDRVVQEFCTPKRSWQLRSASMVIPDPGLLAKALRQEQVTGDSLLNDIDDSVMRNDFGLRTLGQRAFLNHGINTLRRRSAKYQEQLDANQPESLAASKITRYDEETVAAPFHKPTSRLSPSHPQNDEASGEILGAGTSDGFGNHESAQIKDNYNDSSAGGKRQKLAFLDPADDLDHSFANFEAETSTPAPDAAPGVAVEPASCNGKKRKRVAPTLITSEIDPRRYRELPTAADTVVLNDPARNQPLSKVSEPGVVFIDSDGRKRLVPIRQAGSDGSKPPNFEQQHSYAIDDAASVGTRSSTGATKRKVETQKASFGYLGKRRMAVDDMFYSGTAVGKDLLNTEDATATEFHMIPKNIFSGKRLYVNNSMKRFLRSERQDIVRDGFNFVAVIPYPERLALKYQKQSFSLFYTNETGVHVRREELQSWPEIDPAANFVLQNKIIDGHVSSFNPTGPGILDELGRYEETFDPSYLENKYKYLEGGDEVLTIYGHSDEENEYDAATWKEIEEERGEKITGPVGFTRRAHISLEEIEEAIDAGIDELVTRWTRKKLPKLHNRGYRLWRKSRKQGDKRVRIVATQEDLKIINRRIANMRKEILDDVWTSKAQVLKQVPIMEIDVFTREEMKWRIRVLEQSVCPEKPLPLSSSAGTSSRNSIARGSDGEEGESIDSDSYASSSDDGLGDFLVDDNLLPSTEQELHELNLADSEDEPADIDDRDADSPMAGTSDLPKDQPIRPRKCKKFDDSDEGTDGENSRIESTSSPSFSSNNTSTPVKPEKPSLPPLPKVQGQMETEIFDLTMLSSDDSPTLIDLVTPRKPKIKLNVKNSPFRKGSTPITVVESDEDPMPDIAKLPPLNNPEAVSKFSYVAWAKLLDRKRLLVRVFSKMQPPLRNSMLDFLSNLSEVDLWDHMSMVIEAYKEFFGRPKSMYYTSFKGVKGMDKTTFEILVGFVRLFEIYIDCSYHAWREPPDVWSIRKFTEENISQFTSFFELCTLLQDIFAQNISSSTQARKEKANASGLGKAVNGLDSEEDSDEDARPPIKRRAMDITAGQEEVVEEASSQKRKRVKQIFENADARDKREQVMRRLEEQARRRKILHANMARNGHANDEDRGRIIINDAAGEDENFHYISPHIASRIKKHQIDGVRFMWNQIVAGGSEEVTQGCLLAHTMGLGKTMQVITLLVAIAEAADSVDPLISKQIPDKLQRSQTLVLCPPGLIDNWMDELLTWVPNDVLGPLEKITAVIPVTERLAKIEEWHQDGGVLIIGYDMFRNLIVNKKKKNFDTAALTEEQHDLVMEHLLDGPNIIIADEAHKMKNSAASITMAASRFKSTSRIALTGSPLANNVEEYHAMIDWVAPNYLGPIVEFKAKYVEPIQIGLWSDSTAGERRKALKMLKVLNDTLAPKVNRADMSVLRNDLPPKKEFVITVPLTNLQKKAYSLYVRSMASSSVSKTKSGEVTQTTIWHWLTVLSLICNHPKCFDAKIHDRKDEAQKDGAGDGDIPTPQDTSDADGTVLDVNAPAWKIGVSQELLNAATKLFREEAPDLDSIDLSYKVQILCQILDASKCAGDKVLIFSSSIPTLNFLDQICKTQGRKYNRLDGKTKMDKRQVMSKQFNSGSTDIFLISTTAGGLGLNLPGANRVVIFDFKFNPIMEEQAVGRAYRIGQKKPTFVYRFVAGGTFEDHVHNKTVFKMQLASRVVDKKNPVAYATRNLSDFLFEPREIKQHDLSEFKGMDPLVLDTILMSQAKAATICKIVQTDTFEKDDEDRLTAEEEKEVKWLYNDEFLRRTNPGKWHSLQAQRSQQAYDEAHRQAQQKAQQQAHLLAQQQAQQKAQQQAHLLARQKAQQQAQLLAQQKAQQKAQQQAHLLARQQADNSAEQQAGVGQAGHKATQPKGSDKQNPPHPHTDAQLLSKSARLPDHQLLQIDKKLPVTPVVEKTIHQVAQASDVKTSEVGPTPTDKPAISPQLRESPHHGTPQLSKSGKEPTGSMTGLNQQVRSPTPELETPPTIVELSSTPSKHASDNRKEESAHSGMRKPKLNLLVEFQKLLKPGAPSAHNPDPSQADEAARTPKVITEKVISRIEKMFLQKAQRHKAMKLAITVLQQSPEKCMSLFKSDLNIDEFLNNMITPSIKTAGTSVRGDDLSNVRAPLSSLHSELSSLPQHTESIGVSPLSNDSQPVGSKPQDFEELPLEELHNYLLNHGMPFGLSRSECIAQCKAVEQITNTSLVTQNRSSSPLVEPSLAESSTSTDIAGVEDQDSKLHLLKRIFNSFM